MIMMMMMMPCTIRLKKLKSFRVGKRERQTYSQRERQRGERE